MLKLRDEIRNMEKNSYASAELHVPEGGIDCSEGCNPYGFPDAVEKAYADFDIKRFSPYPHSTAAVDAIIDYWKSECSLEKENIMLTDGSISALYLINNLFNVRKAKVLGFAPQFSDFGANVKLLGMDYCPYFVKKEEKLKMDISMLTDVLTDEYSVVYIDNPNNPTGQIFDVADIRILLDKAKKMGVCVLIDEAYGDFMPRGNSSVQFLEEYDNLLVVRTMSKGFGLAGMRAGYILGPKNIIHCMNKVSNPYQVGELSREIMGAALRSGNNLEDTMTGFAEAKRKIAEMTGNNLEMAETCPTVSIMTLSHKDSTVNLREKFLKYGVLTVPGEEFDGLDASYVRIRLPKNDELHVLFDAIEAIENE